MGYMCRLQDGETYKNPSMNPSHADIVQTEVGKLNLCQSLGNHIGGDELNYYCKENGAGNSLAS